MSHPIDALAVRILNSSADDCRITVANQLARIEAGEQPAADFLLLVHTADVITSRSGNPKKSHMKHLISGARKALKIMETGVAGKEVA